MVTLVLSIYGREVNGLGVGGVFWAALIATWALVRFWKVGRGWMVEDG
jgi:hypothetical protein